MSAKKTLLRATAAGLEKLCKACCRWTPLTGFRVSGKKGRGVGRRGGVWHTCQECLDRKKPKTRRCRECGDEWPARPPFFDLRKRKNLPPWLDTRCANCRRKYVMKRQRSPKGRAWRAKYRDSGRQGLVVKLSRIRTSSATRGTLSPAERLARGRLTYALRAGKIERGPCSVRGCKRQNVCAHFLEPCEGSKAWIPPFQWLCMLHLTALHAKKRRAASYEEPEDLMRDLLISSPEWRRLHEEHIREVPPPDPEYERMRDEYRERFRAELSRQSVVNRVTKPTDPFGHLLLEALG